MQSGNVSQTVENPEQHKDTRSFEETTMLVTQLAPNKEWCLGRDQACLDDKATQEVQVALSPNLSAGS